MLGENAMIRLGLDRTALERAADRIGPAFDELMGAPEVTTELRQHFDLRGGYLKPAEGGDRLPEVDPSIATDVAILSSR
jgi:hypothetical protein